MEKMKTILPENLPTAQLHGYLLGAIGPRPIAFASTVDAQGRPNLSPFSFFNVFSANPPVLIFSPARRVRNNTTKHTLENVQAQPEVVINVVNYDIVQQMSLSSTEYAQGVNEFEKAGLTMLASETVAPFRVAEAPVQFECQVTKIEALGQDGGSGNLIFSEVKRIHVHEKVMNAQGGIDQHKIDLVARMGGNWYSRANAGMFEVPKPLSALGIGVDALPKAIRQSTVLTGNDLGMLANVETLPDSGAVKAYWAMHPELETIKLTKGAVELHRLAQESLIKGDVSTAWMLLAKA